MLKLLLQPGSPYSSGRAINLLMASALVTLAGYDAWVSKHVNPTLFETLALYGVGGFGVSKALDTRMPAKSNTGESA